jgi:hypothetical protein
MSERSHGLAVVCVAFVAAGSLLCAAGSCGDASPKDEELDGTPDAESDGVADDREGGSAREGLCIPFCTEGICDNDGCGGTCPCGENEQCYEYDEGAPFCVPTCDRWCGSYSECGPLEYYGCDCGYCDDGDPCTQDSCVPNDGEMASWCEFAPNGLPGCS